MLSYVVLEQIILQRMLGEAELNNHTSVNVNLRSTGTNHTSAYVR